MKITLCGSTRFKQGFELANKLLTGRGHLVYTVGWYGHADEEPAPDQKHLLDALHFMKINEADAILVVDCEYEFVSDQDNPEGGIVRLIESYEFQYPYIGDSTAREIAYAALSGKAVYYVSRRGIQYLLREGIDPRRVIKRKREK